MRGDWLIFFSQLQMPFEQIPTMVSYHLKVFTSQAMKTLKETFGFVWTGSGLSLAEGAAPQSKATMINSIFDNFLFYSPAHSGTADITVPSLW